MKAKQNDEKEENDEEKNFGRARSPKSKATKGVGVAFLDEI